jgi:hypothetical protein
MSPCRSDYIFTDKQLVGVRHVVSEDSDQLGSRFAVVHRLDDFDDLEQPTNCEMRARLNDPDTPNEFLEVQSLRGS